MAFLNDAHRFMLSNRSIVDLAPLQTYYSALVFAPKESIICISFPHDSSDNFRVLPDTPLQWSPETMTLEGHDDEVSDVAFSPDGLLIASMGDDGVRLWNSTTGDQVLWPEQPPGIWEFAFTS